MIWVIDKLEVGCIARQEAELAADEHVVKIAHFLLLSIAQIAAGCLAPIVVQQRYLINIVCNVCCREERVGVRCRKGILIAYGHRRKDGVLFGEQASASGYFVVQILLDTLDDEQQAANRR